MATPHGIRSLAEYASDSDYDDADTLVDGRASGFKRGHRVRPSADALLGDSLVSTLPPDDRLRRLQQYEADAPVSSRRPLLRQVLASGHGVAAFVSRNEGILLIAGSQLLFSAVNACVKLLQQNVEVPVWELIVVRMSITWLGCYTYLRWTGDPNPFAGPPGVRLLLAMRGFFGFFGLFSNYYALSYLSLADTSTLFFVSPILVGLMGFLILREPYSLVEFLVGLASLSGTVFIAKPTFLFSASEAAPDVPGHEVTPEERARAVTVVLVGVVFASSISIIIRYIGTRANALHSIAYFSIYSVLVSATYPVLFHSPPVFRLTARFFALLVPIGVLGFAAQALMTLGLIKEKAGRAALATYSGLLFTLAIEYFLFSHVPDIWSLIGATIIIGGALRIALEHKAHAAASPSSTGAGGAVAVPQGIMQPAAAGGSVAEAQTGRMVGPPAAVGGGGRSGRYDPLAREEEGTDASDGMLREHKR